MASISKANKLALPWNILFHLVIGGFALSCILPMILVIIVSFSSNASVMKNGYSFFPEKWSLEAYRTVFTFPDQILRAYGVTVFVTIVGTLLSIIINGICAYALSRRDLKYRYPITMFMIIPTLFNGGLLPYYLVMTKILHLQNNIFCMIVPGLTGVFTIVVMRTYIQAAIPDSIIESAKIDGASEMDIFFRIVIWLAVPVLATQALFASVGYWNEWYNSMLFITNSKLYPLQRMLMEVQNSITFLTATASRLGPEQRALLDNLPTETARMATLLVATGPIVLAYPYFQRFFIKGIVVGAVKG